MDVKTICLAMIADREARVSSAIDYAVSLAELESAHLACRLAPPELDLPSARLLPMVRALVDEVNAERLAAARDCQAKIETAARLAGVSFDCEILQDRYLDARDKVAAAARASDIVVLPQAGGALSGETGLIEAILFVAYREQGMLRAIERATKQPIEPMNLPSAAAVNDTRIAKFKERITGALAAPGLDLFRGIVECRFKLLIAIHIVIPARLLRKLVMLPALGNVPVLQHQTFTGFRQR